jgi:soluble lytic murein transglycosylase-like protein
MAMVAVALVIAPSPALGDIEVGGGERPRERHVAHRYEALRERHARYEPYVLEAASRHGLPAALLRAVIRVESNYDANAVSRAGALGLMQVLPLHFESRAADGYDPRLNIFVGASLLRRLLEQWHGSLVLALASYNAGSGAVKRYRGVPPFSETRGYVVRVIRHYRAYRVGRMLLRR